MGKKGFVNQKLGKRISRKFDLLKSELVAGAKQKSSLHTLNAPRPKTEAVRQKP